MHHTTACDNAVELINASIKMNIEITEDEEIMSLNFKLENNKFVSRYLFKYQVLLSFILHYNKIYFSHNSTFIIKLCFACPAAVIYSCIYWL